RSMSTSERPAPAPTATLITAPAAVALSGRVRMYLPGATMSTGVVGGDVKGIGIRPSAASAGSAMSAARRPVHVILTLPDMLSICVSLLWLRLDTRARIEPSTRLG